MKKLLIVLLLTTSAFATTTVSGHLVGLGTSSVGSANNAFVRFWLRGCRGNQPRVASSGAIAPQSGPNSTFYVDVPADASGVVSGTIYSTRDASGSGNGDIECGGTRTAVWYGMAIYANGVPGPESPIHANSGSTIDPANVTPLTTQPVSTAGTGDTTYLRLDGGNSPVTGLTAFSGGMTSTTATLSGLLAGTTASFANTGTYATGAMHLYDQFLLDSVSPTTEYQNFQAGEFATSAFTAGAAVPLGATVHQINGIGSYVTSACNSLTRSVCNTTPGYFSARAIGTGAAVWALNPIVGDTAGVTGAHLTGIETDCNVVGTPIFIRCHTISLCITCVMGSTGTVPSDAIALEIGAVSPAQWPMGIRINRGSMQGTLGIVLDGQNTSNNTNSNAVTFLSYNSGGTKFTASVLSNPDGSIQLQPGAGNAAFVRPGGYVQVGTIYSAAGTPLPTCNAGAEGSFAAVKDATAPTYAANYASGGTVHVPVYCNGTNWITH